MMRRLAALLLAAAVAPCLAADPVRFDRAEFIVSSDERIPGDQASWQPLTLPHRWSDSSAERRGQLWYRIRFDLAAAPRAAQAITISHWRSRWVDFYVNGTYVVSSRDLFASGLGLGSPLFFTIPPALFRAGTNEIHARMEITDPIHGLGRVHFGDAWPVLKIRTIDLELNFYAQRQFLAMALGGGLIALFMWLAHRNDRVMLWFAVVTLSWVSAGVLYNAIRFIRVPAVHDFLITYVNYGLPVPAVILALRSADLRWPKLEAALWVILACELTMGTWLPFGAMGRHAFLGGVNASLLLVGAAILLLAPVRQLRWSHRVEVAALALMALLLFYELFRYLGWVDVESAVMRPYHVPVMLLAIGAAICERHVIAMRQARRTQAELQERVDEKAREIEAFHAAREQVMRQQAFMSERQRILADMHDGVGASLVGLLRYAQAGQVDAKTVEQRAREAMQELRIAIDALEPAEGDLSVVLGRLRYRMQPLIEASAVRLAWEVGDLPPVDALDPAAVLSIQRILLEAMSNALQHSGAREIRLSAQPAREGGIEIRLEDDGCGYDPARGGAGRGLGNMRERARALGGSLEVAPRPGGGTAVTLRIPASLAGAPQGAVSERSTLSSAARATAAVAE